MGDVVRRQDMREWLEDWKQLNHYYHPYSKNISIPFSEVLDIVDQLPDAEPPALKHGKWLKEDHDGSWSSAICSVCGRRVGLVNYETDFVKHFPYCHCGAKMDGISQNE